MGNARRAVGYTSTFPQIFMHEDLQNQLNQFFLDSLAFSPPIAQIRAQNVSRSQKEHEMKNKTSGYLLYLKPLHFFLCKP